MTIIDKKTLSEESYQNLEETLSKSLNDINSRYEELKSNSNKKDQEYRTKLLRIIDKIQSLRDEL